MSDPMVIIRDDAEREWMVLRSNFHKLYEGLGYQITRLVGDVEGPNEIAPPLPDAGAEPAAVETPVVDAPAEAAPAESEPAATETPVEATPEAEAPPEGDAPPVADEGVDAAAG